MADEVPNLTVEILKQIRDGVSRLETSLNARMDGVASELRETNGRLSSLESTVQQGFEKTNLRLEAVEIAVLRMAKVNDAVLEEQMKDTEKLEAIEMRLRRLEQHAGLPPFDSNGER
jgi:chromosome segregation ATPase